jgi:hypothetical protein
MKKAIIKFNGGNLALLCNTCSTIIKTGVDFTPDEREFALRDKHLPPQYCETCKTKKMEQQPTKSPVDERNEAFKAFRRLIMEAPLDTEYKIKMLDALSDYLKLIF